MPYTISWHKENTMRIDLTGVVTAEELLTITAETIELVKQAEQRIHAIVDQSKVVEMPRSLSALAGSIPRHKHANQGITILLIPTIGRAERFLSSVVLQILRLEYRIAQSIEEADGILQKIDLTV
jgi:hypothetical protein